jgi:hypothetical protein
MARFFILEAESRRTVAEGETKSIGVGPVDIAVRERRAELAEGKTPEDFVVTDAVTKGILATGRKDPALSGHNLVARLRKGRAVFDESPANEPLGEFTKAEIAAAVEARTLPPEPEAPKAEPPKAEIPKVVTSPANASALKAAVADERVKLLADTHSKHELGKMAEKAGVTFSWRGTKEEIAREIVEAEAAKKGKRNR